VALWAQLSGWLAGQGLQADDLTGERIEAFLAGRRRVPGYLYTVRALAPGLSVLRRVGAIPQPPPMRESPVDVVERQFHDYLLAERGLAAASADTYVVRVQPFLLERARRGPLDLRSLSAAEVRDFAAAWLPELSIAPARSTVTALRSFLSFLHATGVIAEPLAEVVPTVPSWSLTGLARGLTTVQIRALLDSCDQATAVGRRDYAILIVLSRLGLRGGEVAALQLEDIDWRAGLVMVRGKANRQEQLPLPADVGAAVARYLEHARPPDTSARAVFLRAKAPCRGLGHQSVSTMVARAAQRAGLGTVHAHRLRHAVATGLLDGGASLDEIGQLLRHRSRASTAIYAKVDQPRLAQLARPWPRQEQR
jgi:site-specific recombinase XerD